MNNPKSFDSNPQAASGMPTGTTPSAENQATAASKGGVVPAQVQDEVNRVKTLAKAKFDETYDSAKTEAERARLMAEQKIVEVRARAKEATQGFVNERKQGLASQLGVMTDALTRTSDKLHQDQHGAIAQYTDLAADKVDTFRRAIESKDVDDLIDDFQGFARRQPALVFGGLFIAGLAAMRFMKASSHQRTMRELDRSASGNPRRRGDGVTLTPHQVGAVDPSDRYRPNA